jgi:hypothetical protein
MIPLFVAEMVDAFGLCDAEIKKYKQKIEFLLPSFELDNEAHNAFKQRLGSHIRVCMDTKWARLVVFEKGTLQSLLMESLKKPDFKLAACVHFAALHGAPKTFDILELVRDWSLLY